MKTIIQLSDFHINMSFPSSPEKDDMFRGLVEKLKAQDLGEKPILIYNGDIIDQKGIAELMSRSRKRKKSKKWWLEWYNHMKEAYTLAEKYFTYLIDQVGIPKNNVIICCGNHDVFSGTLDGSFTTTLSTCPKKATKPTISSCRFTLFDDFCKVITGKEDARKTSLRKIDGFNILVANSNWIEKRNPNGVNQPLCIDCAGIMQKIHDARNRLANQKKISKLMNVFVAHAPMGDYCENGVNEYPENDFEAAWKDINLLFGLKLYGDKHTSTENHFDYIVGAPLHTSEFKKITYGIHQFDEFNKYHHKSIIFENDSWSIISSEEDISEILRISEPSLKPRALQYLFGGQTVSELALKTTNFTETRVSDNWTYLDKLLKASAEIRIPQYGRSGKVISCKKNGFLDTLTDIICDSSRRICISVKGEPRLGKSVCLTALYINMLYGFSTHALPYLPVYLDAERALNHCIEELKDNGKNRDSDKACVAFSQYVIDFFEDAVRLSKENGKPICCLIDGLSEHFLYEKNRIEEIIDEQINSKEMENAISRVVYCVDTFENNNEELTPQAQAESEYVVYFNRVLSKVGTSNWKARSLIDAYASLQGYQDQAKTVLKNIINLNIFQIDTNLLVHFWDSLKDETCGDYYSLLDSFARRRWTTKSQMMSIAKACFNYTLQNYTYANIHKYVSNEDFDIIRTEKSLTEYLIARNYTRAIEKEYGSPVLNRLFGHNICTLIRADIEKNASEMRLIRFARYIVTKKDNSTISPKGISTLVYLLGRTCVEKDNVMGILDGLEKKLSVLAEKNVTEEKIYFDIARRSIIITKIVVNNKIDLLDSYLNLLIADDSEKSVNRMFYLQFYGDRMDSTGAHFEHELIKEGFDIFRTYHILTSRITGAILLKQRYSLLELELFTLCDLILFRLDNSIAVSDEKNKTVPFAKALPSVTTVPSVFYNQTYNRQTDEMSYRILTKAIEVIDGYNSNFAPSNNNFYYVCYLKMCLDAFTEAREKLKDGPLKEEDAFVANSILKTLMELKSVSRIGWHLKETPTEIIKNDEIEELQALPLIESTEEHTFEAYLIGLLFLPDASREHSEYNKQTVLNIILLHDLGETKVKDIHPKFEDHDRMRDAEYSFGRWLFLQSAHTGVSNLFNYFDLWVKWCKQNDYNALVAKEIDVVHRLFKMMYLFEKEKIDFSNARAREFWGANATLTTVEAKTVFDVLFSGDRKFKEIAKDKGINIVSLLSNT